MKQYILIVILFLPMGIFAQSVSSISSDMFSSINQFKNSITDEDECRHQISIIDDLVNDVDNLLDDTNDSYEIKELRQLKRKLEAVEDYMGTVGVGRMSFVKEEDFYLANGIIGGSFAEISKSLCAQIMSVTINEYVAFVALNKQSETVQVTVDWNFYGSSKGGIMEMGLAGLSFRRFADNSNDTTKKRIIIKSVSCKTFN